MKKGLFSAIFITLLLASVQASAKGGLSIGVFGAYATDGGPIEDKIESKVNWANNVGINYTDLEHKPTTVAGSGVVLKYEFRNGYFLRSGVEYYRLVYGDELTYGSGSFENKWEYEAIAAPVFFGISLSPDRGKTRIYGAAGLMVGQSEIKHDQDDGGILHESSTKGFIYGFGGLFGIEKKITRSIFFMMEYAFYKCEVDKSATFKLTGGLGNDLGIVERLGLPRQQIRLGAGYNF